MQNRRTLHEPFFPTPSAPPPSSSSSSSSNSNSPPFPKYPFSSNPQQPFFPNYPSPPPPSTSNVPTFPANLSSLIYPQNGNYTTAPHHKHSSTGKLLPSILISLILLSLLSLTAAFLFHRRRRRHHHHLNPKKPTPPPPPPPPPPHVHPSAVPPTSDFLYLGTLVNSQNHHHHRTHSQTLSRSQSYASNETNVAVPAGGSPELRPLPPLAKSVRTNYANATDSDEEFYSPKGSDNPIGTRSSSRREFQFPAGDEKTGSDFSSTPSYPDSNSDNGSESPNGFGSKHPRSASPPTAPPPPPPPPPPMRPHTPSPPKRKLPSPSPISSPARNSRSSARSPSPARFQATPPPPPPPPPPVGYWESQVRKPPVVVKPRSVNFNVNRMVETGSGAEVAESWESVVEMSEETTPRPRPKLKPLHWDKVRASSDRVTVWDQLKTSSFQVNEEMIETLFGTANAAPKEVSKSHQVLPSPKKQEVDRVLDPKKSQNIAILLRALNVTKEEVCEALLEGNTDSLGTDLLETLLKMAPSKEEEIKLKEYKDDSPFKLGPAEKFLKALLDIPFAFKRVDAMLYIANFDSEVSYLKNSFETLEAACEELRNSRLFLKLLEAVLKTGNRMNVGTNRGDAHAFKLDTLLKLVDVKGTDGKITLLHFVVQEIIRTEGSRQLTPRTQANTLKDDLHCKRLGLQVVSGLGGELANVKKAASMDSEVLSSYVSKLAGGIGKISEVLRLNESLSMRNSISIQFQERMDGFLKKAEDGIIKVQAQESVALSLVKEITEYFHGNSAKEEAHPFRIFMVVRDFLSILDQVCKEVGRINEKSIASSARQFPVPVNPTLPPLFPKIQALRPESSDDENSSSSS